MADATGAEQKKPRRRRKKEKKEEIQISLYINGIPYEYGVICTFCTKVAARVHCAECGDFYCKSCDLSTHMTKKRRTHIRKKISKLTKDAAAVKVTHAFIFFVHLKRLQELCRQKFRRFFDKTTLNHYYFNTVYGTSSWRKPYCLRKQELFPFLDQHSAICRIQGIYRAWKARDRARRLLLTYYKKIFDRRKGQFYYAFSGKSTIIPKSSWKKPRLCGRRSYPKDIPIIYTPDVAALIIQRKWRSIFIRELWRALARISYKRMWDPVKGRWNYYDKSHGVVIDYTPLVMRQQPWDPNNVNEWDIKRVTLFLRRIGLKEYVKAFQDYFVDGPTLLMVDEEDYENMNITNHIHIRKIEVELRKIYTFDRKPRPTEELIARREKIRKHKLFNAAAEVIQGGYRAYVVRKEARLRKEIERVLRDRSKLEADVAHSSIWWSDRNDIPSRKPDRRFYERENLPENPKAKEEMLKLPPIPVKNFGRNRDHLSAKGFGRRQANGEWLKIDAPQLFHYDHPTRMFSEKLAVSGYDRRRQQRFLGQAVDPFEFKIEEPDKDAEQELLL